MKSIATSCAKKGGGGKGRLCDGLRVYPMIGNSASEKPENLILPFARGTTRDSFPDQRTEPNGWVTGRDTTLDSKQYCDGAKRLQFLIVSRNVETKGE